MKTPTSLLTLLTLALNLTNPTLTTAHGTHSKSPGHKAHTHGSRAVISSAGLDSGLNKPLLQGYSLTWHEEFTYPSSSNTLKQPSTAKWIYDSGHSYPGGPANWGSNELQSYTNKIENIRITEQGTLYIIPRKNTKDGSWTSARIETVRSDFKAQRGGKLFVEARIKTGCAYAEKQQGIWNAFWALGSKFRGNYQNWPSVSEWDILEVINGQSLVHNALHCGTAPGGPCNEFVGLTNGGTKWSKCNWHYVGFEVDRTQINAQGIELWRNNVLNWYVDGVKTFSLTGRDVNDWDTWVEIAHQGHFLLLNVAVGGDWPGYPDEKTVDAAGTRLEVDYVRVWNR
ncbi:glycoside hydrolase family 16 protein [Aspergillus stella-maris]|uniref:glycoside hydrolase family 16 protein n=1 Tax=Aspergillus stella-maris TaxID=1810926 RepID=UPI003CCCF53F